MALLHQAKAERHDDGSAAVFISYSRSDDEFVTRLEAALQQRGVRVFRDRKDIEKAEDWWTRIEQLVTDADSIVFVLSPAALASPIALREVEFAATLNKRFLPVVAAAIDGIEPPAALARLNYIHFIVQPRAGASGDFDAACDDLVRAIGTDIGWIRDHTRLGDLARRWEAAGAGRHLLLRGPALDAAERWLAAQPRGAPTPAPLHQAFVAASRQGATRRLRLGIAGAVGVALLSAGLAGLAWFQKEAATRAQQESFVRQADLSASLAFRLYEQGDSLLGLKVARSGAPETISEMTPLRPRLALALSRGWAMVQEEAGLRHPDGQILDAAWSPNGEYVVTATLTDGARLWRAATGELVQSLSSGIQPDYVMMSTPRLVDFDGDGAHVAVLSDGRVRVWNTARLVVAPAGEWRTTALVDQPCDDSPARVVRLSPDARVVAARCSDGLFVWRVDSGRLLWSRRHDPLAIDGFDGFDFVADGRALLLLGAKSVQLLEGIAAGQPRLRDLDALGEVAGGDEIHALPGSSAAVVVVPDGYARIDLARQTVVYRRAIAVDRHRRWVRYAKDADTVAVAWVTAGNDLGWQLADARTGAVTRSGELNFTGRNAAAAVRNIALSDDARQLAVALTTGAFVLRLDRSVDFTAQAHLQQLKGNAQVVFEEPCSSTSAPVDDLRFAPDGARFVLVCNGITRIRRLADPVAAADARADRVLGIAPARRGVVRLLQAAGGRVVFDSSGGDAAAAHDGLQRSPPVAGPIADWQVSGASGAVFWVGADGRAGSWRPGDPAVTVHAGVHPDPRAMRFGADGRDVALLTADGWLVRYAIGRRDALHRVRLADPGGGRLIPRIRYEIAPDLDHVAFTTRDLRDRGGLATLAVVVSVPAGAAPTTRCVESPPRAPAALLFGGSAGSTRLRWVDRNRTVAEAPLAAVSTPGAELAPVSGVAAGAVRVRDCPAGLMARFVDGEQWSTNAFTDLTVALLDDPPRLLYADGAGSPLELIDPTTSRRITELVDGHGARSPLAVSRDGRHIALRNELGNGVSVFDAASGTLLRRLIADGAVEPAPGALAFDAEDRHLIVRLRGGGVQVFPLRLQHGDELLRQIREIGLQPMTDAEQREIYEFRKRFPRIAAFG